MIELLKEIILDFQQSHYFTGVIRSLQIEALPNKATVCIGVRRCGKSTYLLQIAKKMLDKGVPKENIVYINFFDDRLHELQQTGLQVILEAYFLLYPHKKENEKIYLFFDELQMINGWEAFVERVLRTENCEVYISGSSAKLLSKEIASQMRGRALSWEMFPFSFTEFLTYKNIVVRANLAAKERFLIENAYLEYWKCGGFPEVLDVSRDLRVKVHQEYFHTVLFKDLLERYDINHPKALVDLAHRLINNIASLYSLNSLSGYLHSVGHKVSKTTLSDYLAWFEDAYFMFTVGIFDASITKNKVNPKKIYCIDHALVTSVANGILLNKGHLLENLVFVALRRVSKDIYYYKTKKGKEVDFVAKLHNKWCLIQVCATMLDSKTRAREIAALQEAMVELNINTGIIVTSSKQDVEDAAITCMPAWQFLLKLDSLNE